MLAHPKPSPAHSRKVTTFYEEDEERNVAGPSSMRSGSGPASGQQIKDQRKRSDEAERLLVSRRALPIWEGRAAILEAVAQNDTVIILGETGSGKTTQLPQFLLDSTVPITRPRIAVTQPRRVAATTLATRVAAEVGCELGTVVGYTVRFDDVSLPTTRLKYMTDGTLLAEMLGDRNLNRYDCIVLDEAHERSLRTDMLMGFLKDVQVRRKAIVRQWSLDVKKGAAMQLGKNERAPTELKIIVMSATLDAKRFSDFFNNAPVLYIKGRQYDVKIFYTQEAQNDYCEAALTTIFDIHLRLPPGDILVFLPGQEDIENLTASIKAYMPDLHKSFPGKEEILICPLYAKLLPAEQAKAFAPAPLKTRKVILATNVAETSVTINGVRYVIDTGMCKEKEYHATVGIDSLSVQSISQSSARQRTGRAGRQSDGRCYRLYPESAFLDLPAVSKPEIQRVSLTFAILHLLASGQEDIWTFQYMDPPSRDSMKMALMVLRGLDAIDDRSKLTALGKAMATLPLDPLYSRVLLGSFDEGCPSEVIDLVSLIGFRDSLLHSSGAIRDEANLARAKFLHRSGDHFMLLNILRAYEEVPREESKAWCKAHFINARVLATILETRRQLRERCTKLGKDWNVSCGDDSDPVLSACMRGLFGNTAILQADGTYRHAMSKQVISIHPASSMHSKKAAAIMYDELVLTSKTYARGVSSIPVRWIRTKVPQIFDRP